MAQKKASEVDGWLARPPADIPIVLLYGPDRGLVSERARKFATSTGLPLDDPFSVVTLDAAEIDGDDSRLIDEARTVPMFASRRLLWLRNAGAQKGLADQVKLLCAEPPRDAIVLIEAGDLKKGVALRSTVETAAAAAAMALPCYADEQRGIDQVIDEELSKAGLTITLDARQALRRNLGGDRLASRGEVAKLALYAHGKTQIDIGDIDALTGDVSGASLDEAVDAMLGGDAALLDAAVSRHLSGGSQIFPLLAAVTRQLQALQALRSAYDNGGRNAAAAVAGARPPVFFTRRKLMERAVESWASDALDRALGRVHAAVLQTRKRPDLAAATVRNLLLSLCLESARALRAKVN